MKRNRHPSLSVIAGMLLLGNWSLATAQGPTDLKFILDNPLTDVTLEQWTKFVNANLELMQEHLKNTPGADKSPRENAYTFVHMVLAAGCAGSIAMPIAGTGVGGGLGVILGAAVTVETGPGAVAGGAIGGVGGLLVGFGSGVAAGLTAQAGSYVLAAALSIAIDDKYPPSEAGGPPRSFGDSSGARVVTRTMPPPYAGPMESLLILNVQSLPDVVETVARRWDNMQGLPDPLKKWLAKHDFLRKPVQRLAYIKQNGRIAPNAPPLAPNMLAAVTQWVDFPSDAEWERWWFRALGLSHTKLDLGKDKLILTVAPVLQAAGAPKTITLDTPDINLKFGGNGGLLDPYIRMKFKAGPAKLDLGKVSTEKDRIKIDWDIDKGSSLGNIDVNWKWNGPEKNVFDITPKLGKKFSGGIYLKLDGMGLVPAGFFVDHGIDVDFKLPKELKEAVDALKDLVEDSLGKIAKEVEKVFESKMPWDDAFKKLGKAPGQSIERVMLRLPFRFGMVKIDKIVDMEIRNGKLRVKVAGQELTKLALPQPIADFAKSWNAKFSR